MFREVQGPHRSLFSQLLFPHKSMLGDLLQYLQQISFKVNFNKPGNLSGKFFILKTDCKKVT